MAILVNCEKLDHFGRGIVRYNNKVVFVPNLLPLEEADIEIVSDKKKFMVGKIVKIIKKSPFRITPKCPYENCGCALKHLNYEKTLEYKKNKVIDILKRYADVTCVKDIISSDNIYGYRNKITLNVRGKVGYFENETNNLIVIKRCELASEKMNEIIKVLNSEDLSKVQKITIKEFDEIMIIIDGKMDISNLKKYSNSIFMNDKLVYGNERVLANIDSFKFWVSKDSFFQVNNLVSKLYCKVLDYLPKDENLSVLDLYCGTGTISIFLSKHFKKVTGIEINEEAIKCALDNKKINNISNVSFIVGDVSKKIHDLRAEAIVVDPPRAGLSSETTKDILKMRPKTLVYVSCDPMTLARDLKILKDIYDVKEATLFDMFPWTYHVETVAVLKLKEK